jgi:hypothetical protein
LLTTGPLFYFYEIPRPFEIMKPLRIRLLLAWAVAAAACSSATADQEQPSAAVRVVNATGGPIDVVIDGRTVAAGVPLASVSSKLEVAPGTHQLQLQPATGNPVSLTVESTAGSVVPAAAYPGMQSSMDASVLVDTGAVVAAGRSKLRVVHLAASVTGIEIWRSQPDFQTPVHIMTPFPYEATSPYLESTPGNWEVFVTAAGSGTKLATTGAVQVPSGQRRTAALMDSAGVLRFRVIAE